MCVDKTQLPSSSDLNARLTKLLDTPLPDRASDPLIWEVDSKAVGLTNLNAIERGKQADIHLHLFDPHSRGKGLGRRLFMMSVQKYFQRHGLAKIVCQPASANPGPTGLMRALEIPVARTYLTKPSMICFEHEVNRYEINQAIVNRILNTNQVQKSYDVVASEYVQRIYDELRGKPLDRELLLLLAFHLGEECIHKDDWWDLSVSIDFFLFQTNEVTRVLTQVGFEVEDVIERDPYPEVEHQSRRAYIFCRRA